MTDIINELSHASAEVQQLRRARHDAQENAQLSFSALLEPAEPGEFSYAERYAVAAFTAAIYQTGEAADFYFDLLSDEADADLVAAVRTASQRGVSTGPYYQGDFLIFGDTAAESVLGERLSLIHI